MPVIPLKSQSRPAVFAKTVLLAADARYFPYAMFTADMIHRHHPQRDFDICLVSAEPLPEHPLVNQIGIRLLQLDIHDIESRLHTDNRFSVAAYLRFLVPEVVAQDYKRILYMDGDMLLLRGDLSRLLEADIGPHAIGAVRDDNQLRKNRIPKDMQALKLGPFKYLNSGLLLMDVAEFNARNIGPRTLDLAIEKAAALRHHDQSALNGVLQGAWAELPMAWNFQFCHKTLYFAVHFNPAILHFITSQKPWSSRHGIYPRWIQARYLRFFRQHFPKQAKKLQALPPPANKIGTHILMLLLHAVNFRKFIRNANRFEDDWDIKI